MQTMDHIHFLVASLVETYGTELCMWKLPYNDLHPTYIITSGSSILKYVTECDALKLIYSEWSTVDRVHHCWDLHLPKEK